MYRRENKHYSIILKSLELLGKPVLLLFTIIAVFGLSSLHLITFFIRKLGQVELLFFSHLRLPSLPTLPKASRRKHQSKRRIKPTRRAHLHFQLPRLSVTPIVLAMCCLLLVVSFYYYVLKDLPSPAVLADHPPALSTKILARDGTLLYQIYKDQNRTLVKLADLPPQLVQATLAAEDKNFYHHPGVDITGILRALRNNLTCNLHLATCNSTLQGGSTLTQQLIKNTLLTPEKSLVRKAKEAVLAIQTERLYSKDQILEMYLNQVPYGGTAYGIEEAAHQYLGKNARDLTLAESALLAGLPVAPTSFSPFGHSLPRQSPPEASLGKHG